MIKVSISDRWIVFSAVLLVCAILLANSPLRADVFELSDGRRVEGTVLRELDTMVVIRTSKGVETLEKSQIVSREKKQTIYDQYLARKKALKSSDLEGHLELAAWCIDNKLIEEAVFHFKHVLRLDPMNAAARAALGYEKIHGEWYLKGSPEAEEARKAKKNPYAGKMKEIPADYHPTQPEPKHEPLHHIPSGAPRVRLVIHEKIMGKKPEHPITVPRLQEFMGNLRDPLVLVTGEGGDADYTLEVTLRVNYVRTQMFYGKIPITNIFRGEVSVELKPTAEGAAPLFRIPAITQPFSANTDIGKEKAGEYAYFDTVQKLLHFLSVQTFFTKRGAKPIKSPPE